MEVKWIEDFLALVQYKSFSRAAEARRVTQSGFSRRIQSLETWFGAELFDRSTFPPVLTNAGSVFHDLAEDLLERLHDARTVVRKQQRMSGHAIQIAADQAASVHFLPDWLQSLRLRNGDVRARVVPASLHDAVASLVNRNSDLLLTYLHPSTPIQLDAARYPGLLVGRDALVPVSKPSADGTPLYRLAAANRSSLPYAAYAKNAYFSRCLETQFSNSSLLTSLQPHYESESDEVLKRFALNGAALAWLPRSAVKPELASGALVEAGDASHTVDLEVRLYRDALNRAELVDRIWFSIASVE
jgi:LysR family transcriptional regulator, hypochlorite-specific transcription factor HypT